MTAMDAFLRECGGVEPLRVELLPSGGGTAVCVEFHKPFVLVGRGSGADMGVDNPATALRQLYLQLVGGRLYAVQLSEDYPTLRGGGVWRSGWVAADDPVLVDETDIRFLNPVHAGAPPAAAPVLAGAEPLFSLECAYGTGKSRLVTNSRPLLLIGRSAPAKLIVRHRSLSPVHAAVVATTGGRFWLVDLSPEAGLLVNGKGVSLAPLADGDVFHCGQVAFHFTLPTVAERATDPVEPEYRLAPQPPAPAVITPTPVPEGAALGTVLDQFAQLQQHSYDQFRQMLGTVMQMVGGVMADQRAFVKDELDRMERIMLATARMHQPPPPPAPLLPPAATVPPPPALPAHPPGQTRSEPTQPAVPDVQLHSWVEGQLQSLRREQDTIWKKLRRSVTGEPPPG